MSTRIEEVAAGTLGHFWEEPPHDLDLAASRSGHVELDDSSRLRVSTLATHEGWEITTNPSKLPRTPALYGMTHATGAIFFDHVGTRREQVIGAPRAWTESHFFRGMVAGLRINDVASSGFSEVSLIFPDVYLWSCLLATEQTTERDAESRCISFTASSKRVPKLAIQVSRHIQVEITPKWMVTGQPDSLLVSSPMVVTSRSSKPADWQEHLSQLVSIRDLINLAYGGFVVASSGSATLDYRTDAAQSAGSPEFWSGRFMAPPPGVDAANTRGKFPIFNLASLGSIKPIKRWIILDREHPRATGPLVNRHRVRNMGVETRLIELAAAIEYWTRAHQDLGRRWADPIPKEPESKKKKPWPTALALKAGPAFAEYVGGDVDAWSEAFWDAYTSLKHIPNYQYDGFVIDLLATSGEVLLLGSLLARCTGNRAIIDTVCQSTHYHDNGYELRQYLKKRRP